MEEIIEKTKQLSLGDISGMLKPNQSKANNISQASLVGKLFSRKIYPFRIIQPIIKSRWRFLPDLRIEDVGPNRFIFTFTSVEEKDCIVLQGPWNFKGSYMILKDWDPTQTPDEVDLAAVVFWVQIHGLPLEILDEENARLIRSKLGVILEMDDIDKHHSFLRLKIKFHVSTPLEPGFYFSHDDGESVWIGFKYQRLSSFCFHCGLIDHTIGACYQNSPHPQRYALTDKLRGVSHMRSLRKARLRGLQADTILSDRGNSLQSSLYEKPPEVGWAGKQAVDSSPVGTLPIFEALGAKQCKERFFSKSFQ